MTQPEWTICKFCRYDLTSVAPPAEAPTWAAPPDPFGAAFPPPPVAAPVRRGRPLRLAAAGGVLAAGAVAFVFLGGDAGPSHPDEWDPRVQELADFAEDHRDLEFDHPVHVDFLTEAEYTEATRTDDAGLSAEEREEIAQAEGQLRALGLAPFDIDLLESLNDLSSEGTLAFYDPATEHITVKGTELTPDLRVTLVHELVHVLQDQHFDISEERFDSFDDGQDEPFRAIVEGDAIRIEDEYIETLSAEDRAVYEANSDAGGAEARQDLASVPSALVAIQQAPYLLGDELLRLVITRDGVDAVDDLFIDPPSSEEQLFVPTAYLEDDDPSDVEIPSLPAGVTESLDEGDFGYVGWLLTLGDRIDPLQALTAADGWGGDSYVTFEQDGRTCIRAAFLGETSDATAVMRTALQAWVSTMPAASAEVVDEGDTVVLQSCDPGEELVINDRSVEVLLIPLFRTAMATTFVEQIGNDAPFSTAFSFGDCTVRGMEFSDFQVFASDDPTDEAINAAFADRDRAQTECLTTLGF